MSRATPESRERGLVMDYLVHHGYSSTARAFERGSMVPTSLDADGDAIMDATDSAGASRISEETFLQIELRQRIRAHILTGCVADAIELLETHFPSVLSSETLPSAPTPFKSLTGTDFVASTTLNPAHLTLNLRILAFTEAFRTAPLDRVLHSTTDASPLEEDDPKTLELISKARKLHILVSMLPNPTERAAYTQELRNVAGLLAYPDPQSSPVAKYLSQERREAVANQINTAILYRTGFAAISRLELSTRYISTLWSFLHDFRVKPRPGALLPPTSVDRAASPSLRGVKPAENAPEVPRFDLQQFLNSKP
ncbi:lish motif-containing protein [Mycena maculata]|uniref:Lish motif-containing protein n=1 Tax=Mycena maculata TaxID=230809 RepID=A0AAD7IEU7_9AGAR|nr:lish motif-containing protein [Mycena maculata]